MQANTITLSVDAANTGTPANQVYSRYEEYPNRSSYIGDDHLPEVRNTMGIYRTFPTRTGNFKGASKSAVKFTQDVVVPGVDSTTEITSPIIVEVSFSVPVGAASADLKELRQRVIAALDQDALMDSLSIQLMV